jgi:hypothetical protein
VSFHKCSRLTLFFSLEPAGGPVGASRPSVQVQPTGQNFLYPPQNARQEAASNGMVTIFFNPAPADFRDNSGIKHGSRGNSK